VIAPCARGGCPEHTLKPLVDPASSEPDPMQSALAGAPRNEVVYADWATSAGAVHAGASSVIIDPTKGPRDDYAATWTPPDKAVGETRIWALVRDDRAGLTWWSVDVVVR
jgi:hypothetical protein